MESDVPTRAPVAQAVTNRRRVPVPCGYFLPYFAPFCYSPRGTSATACRSRELRDALKCADPETLAHCAHSIATLARFLAPQLFDASLTLVPIPAHLPKVTLDPPTPAEAVAQFLRQVGIGAAVWPALYRRTAVAKSAWSHPDSRPGVLEHVASLRLKSLAPPTRRLLLIDDVITRGRTLLAAAATLQRAFPSAHIEALAVIRTEGVSADIDAIAGPVTGVIRYVVGDAFRSP